MAFRIYTKTGDRGETALFGGRRVSKSDLRVDAYGTVDELNSFVGLLHDALDSPDLRQALVDVQHRLFSLGAYLASDPTQKQPAPDIRPEDISILETEMDRMDDSLPALQNFILPAGHPTVSMCHVCRTVCRRAERLVVALHHQEALDELVLQYLNRLSDYFFILARFLGREAGVKEVIWQPRKNASGIS